MTIGASPILAEARILCQPRVAVWICLSRKDTIQLVHSDRRHDSSRIRFADQISVGIIPVQRGAALWIGGTVQSRQRIVDERAVLLAIFDDSGEIPQCIVPVRCQVVLSTWILLHL